MNEDFLYYVWRFQLFNTTDLITARGFPLQIINPGTTNHHSGPDFSNARIKIDETLWAGNIEIHLRPSDWQKHGHDQDDAYKSVILHVIYDLAGYQISDPEPDCLEVKNYLLPHIMNRYYSFLEHPQWIPCEKIIQGLPHELTPFWLQRLSIERLEQKTVRIQQDLEAQKWNWDEVFYQHVARTLGMKVNSEAMQLLAKLAPAKLLYKHGDNLFHLEALLLGQSGLLNQDFKEDYPQRLKIEYLYWKNTYLLEPLPSAMWKFMRMRPANFPTLRIAQLAMLMFKSQHLFSKILAAQSVKELVNTFDIKVSNYWHNHYILDKPANKPGLKTMGKQVVYNLIINTLIPFIFLYGRHKNIEAMERKALEFLTQLPAENNTVLRQWKQLGLSAAHAGDSQALLQLNNHYCSFKKCLYCHFGHALLKT